MTTVYLAPTFGAGYQAFTSGGLPLNAGKIYTYIAGGTTPQATYTTSAGNVQNENPIVLGADGRPPSEVWLTGAAYRFDVKDSNENLIKTYDNLAGIVDAYNLSQAGTGQGANAVGFKQAGSGMALRTMQTKAREIMSITDSVPAGTDIGDGTTDAAPYVQTVVDAIKTLHHGAIYCPNPTASYRLASPIDVSQTSDIHFIGEGGTDWSYPLFSPDHNGQCVFDLTGSSNTEWSSISVRTKDNITYPKCVWLEARDSTGASAGDHVFWRCYSYGKYSVSPIYSYASENNEYHACEFANQETGGSVVTITATNINSVTSPFCTIATGTKSNIDANFYGGRYYSFASGGSCFRLDLASCVNVYGPWMAASNGSTGGDSIFYVDTTNGASDSVNLDGVIGENFGGGAPNYDYFIHFAGGTAGPTGWVVKSARFAAKTNSILGANGVTVDGLQVFGMLNLSGAASTVHKLTNSLLSAAGAFTVRSTPCTGNVFIGGGNVLPAGQNTNTIIESNTGAVRTSVLTQVVNPANVSVPTATPTAIFDIGNYITNGQAVTFTFTNGVTILGKGMALLPGSGSPTAQIIGSALGSGVALGMSGTSVTLTQTTGGTVTISTFIDPASAVS